MANLLHEGKNIILSKYLLASHYESLGIVYEELLKYGSIPTNMEGLWWLLQLWLNMVYAPTYFPPPLVPNLEALYGSALALIVEYVRKDDSVKAFKSTLIGFLISTLYYPSSRSWPKKGIVLNGSPTKFHVWMLIIKKWPSKFAKNLPTCQVLHTLTQNNKVVIILYQPNIVARQLGLSRVLTSPGFSFSKKPFGGTSILQDIFSKIEQKLQLHAPTLSLFEFEISHMTTPNCERWWSEYFNNVRNPFLKWFYEILCDIEQTMDTKRKQGKSLRQIFIRHFGTAHAFL